MAIPNVGDDSIEALCNRCGKTFSMFLHEMADQNAKVVCPDCGAAVDCEPVKDAEPAAGRRPIRKPN
jgi:DNA-directed RNA polymerase subunit RPC12/RpoP